MVLCINPEKCRSINNGVIMSILEEEVKNIKNLNPKLKEIYLDEDLNYLTEEEVAKDASKALKVLFFPPAATLGAAMGVPVSLFCAGEGDMFKREKTLREALNFFSFCNKSSQKIEELSRLEVAEKLPPLLLTKLVYYLGDYLGESVPFPKS